MYYDTAGRNVVKINKKYKKHLETYERFAKDLCDPGFLDFSELSAEQLFISESYGMTSFKERYNLLTIPETNGFYQGKRMFNITLSMWKEDIVNGLLFFEELEKEFNSSILKRLI